MVHEGDMVSLSQRDLPVTELLLQATVEEAEQELVGQAGGALEQLLILCWNTNKHKYIGPSTISYYQRHLSFHVRKE